MDKEKVVAALRRCADGHMLIVSDVDLLRTLAERIERGVEAIEADPYVVEFPHALIIDWSPDKGSE